MNEKWKESNNVILVSTKRSSQLANHSKYTNLVISIFVFTIDDAGAARHIERKLIGPLSSFHSDWSLLFTKEILRPERKQYWLLKVGRVFNNVACIFQILKYLKCFSCKCYAMYVYNKYRIIPRRDKKTSLKLIKYNFSKKIGR